MAQFSSGKHMVVSHDPWPFVVHSVDHGEIRLRANEGYPGYRIIRDPRVDFDHPLTNPPNPILAAARANPGSSVYYADLPEWPTYDQIEHATTVLRRLARIRGGA